MKREPNLRSDQIRARSGELPNHLIDELTAGRLDRREFLRRASVAGLSASAVGVILAACGSANSSAPAKSATSASGPAKAGGSLRVAQQAPAAAVNPLTVADAGGLNLLAQTGEYLVFDDDATLSLQPMLATKWSSNSDGSVWTFTLRQGVKFHGGQTMSAADVVWVFKQLSDPKNASNALSNFGGVLLPDGVRKVDDSTVAFHLQAPNGNFPYLVSSDNYNAIIVPAGTDYAKWPSTFVGTGAFQLDSFSQSSSASFVPNPDYWGAKALLAKTTFNFYASEQPQILAMEGGDADLIAGFVPQGAEALLTGKFTIISRKSSGHREISMRNDKAPFNDARVRRAVALTLNRPALISSLMSGHATLGNDSPFAQRFPSTDPGIPQRKQDIAQAKQLLAAAGHPNGFSATYVSEQALEMPALAQLVQAEAKQVGIDFNLQILQQGAYYGKSTFGNSPWLDATVSAVDYGDRGTPNTFLQAALGSNGVWNAAHFKNPTYDKLVTRYVAAVDLQTQRQLAGQIQQLLLNETPVMIPYFLISLTASTPNVRGVNPSSIGAMWLQKASIA